MSLKEDPSTGNRAGMTGIVVVGHGRLAEAMVNVLEGILGPVEAVAAVTTSPWDGCDAIEARIEGAVRRVGDGGAVLILTDMLGDTQTNLSVAVARLTGAEVVAGVNMPMLIKAATERERLDTTALAEMLRRYGQEHIFWATEPGARRAERRAVR
jgi:PTS system mannose-specific IIA component